VPEALRLALTTLTVLPLRAARLDRRTAGRAMELAPLAGVLLGLAAAGLVVAVRWREGGNLLAAAVGVGALAALTRGLHLDGLADLADGLGSYRDPAGTRAVMKSPEVGPLGLVSVVLVLLVQVAALARCLDFHTGTASLLLAVVTGRVAVTAACRRTPAATPDGLGALVADTVRPGAVLTWTTVLLTVFVPWAAFDPEATGPVGVRVVAVVVAVAAGLGAARLLRTHAVRRVGGLTGDVLGALVEVTTTVVLVVLALGGPPSAD
jgi:adenosylcobinamide-GDP ribazoletransferase